MLHTDRAQIFNALHVKGEPFMLYNVWDAGSAKVVESAGAPAVATSSWAVAASQGYEDGEAIPLRDLQRIVARIAASVEVPLTVDFEGGYGNTATEIAENLARLLNMGIAGLNFEDRIVPGAELYDVSEQAKRIGAIRKAADSSGIPLFINARTDVFLGSSDAPSSLMNEAKARAFAYAEAGASGFFVPGLEDETLIAEICDESPLPVNVMVTARAFDALRLSELGIARISFGPVPYISAMESLGAAAKAVYGSMHASGLRARTNS